ncbi:MAG: sensor histidine kinase KdpD [Candidatus Eisenbacteria bacterium]
MIDSEGRPDPDVLLRRVHAEEQRQARARLKIFFGYAPGVGKTFTMLESARRLRAEGVDLVVGWVETHGRPETAALLAGLEILPRREFLHRQTRLAEFDIDRALTRKPRIILLDELAHTNAPQSRHPKRWQDALELLEAGIEVHSTLNVQHIESLNDVVAQITHVRVRETVPDAILERADEIELVDLPPDELLTRLHEGKVYIPAQAQRAADHFFRRGNLLALRELTLRRAAERVDADVHAYRQDHQILTTWPAAEKILVCVGPSPSSAQIVRGARRMAAGLRAPWVAVYADAPDAFPMDQSDRDRLQTHLRLAESMGGEVVRLSGSQVSEEILRYAREHNVTRIIVGKPTHRRWRDIIKGSLVDDLVRGSGEIEIHFIGVTPGEPPVTPAKSARSMAGLRWQDYGYTALLVAAATAISALGRHYLAGSDFVMVFLLVIMIAAFRFGRGPSLAAAALSVAAYDYFLVPPFFTFSVEHARHFLTFAMMFGVGLTISSLVSRIRRQEREARLREQRTAALYSLTRALVAAPDEEHAARATAGHAAEVFGGQAAVLLPAADGKLAIRGAEQADLQLDDAELAVAQWAADHGRPTGLGTDTLPGSRVTCVPLQSGPRTMGVLTLRPASAERLEIEQRAFLDAFVRQATLALERAKLGEEARTAAMRVKTEEMRSALLSAVSHDLRTPLAAITGAGTALRDDAGRIAEEQRAELLDTICGESERMERLIGNLLDMMRLESGQLQLKREWIPLEEIVGSALARLDARLGGREVVLDLPADLPLVSVDPVLFEQVFVNLIENAAKYTPPAGPIEVHARAWPDALEIAVADRGPGLPAGRETSAFEKFWRGAHPGIGGVGLGLPICQGIVEAHGGTINAENRTDGGALFRLRLPRLEAPADAPIADPTEPGPGRPEVP